MTAPIDPRPYAAPTDLVTAADVARWLHEIDDGDITGGDPMWLTISRLDARLDRERRQACRRGALVNWRRWSSFVRKWRDVWTPLRSPLRRPTNTPSGRSGCPSSTSS